VRVENPGKAGIFDPAMIRFLLRLGLPCLLLPATLLPPCAAALEPASVVSIEPRDLVEYEEQPLGIRVLIEKAGDALTKIDWPTSWQVIGPLAPDAPPLSAKQLSAVPKSITLGETTFDAYAFPANDHRVDLVPLLTRRPGGKPNHGAKLQSYRISAPKRAWAFAEISVPADGMLYINATADWSMRWFLNGKPIYDAARHGNNADPNKLDAHPFAVAVKKGKHVIAVHTGTGGKGWSFASIGAFSATPQKLAEFHVPSKIRIVEPDPRLQPAFNEIPHPPTRMKLWLEKIESNEARLREIASGMPGTAEGEAANDLLARLANDG